MNVNINNSLQPRCSPVRDAAQTMGPVVATPLAGLLVDWYGWPSCFYSYGVFGLLFSLLVLKYGADSPMAHKTIDPEERAYITASLGGHSDKVMEMTHPTHPALELIHCRECRVYTTARERRGGGVILL